MMPAYWTYAPWVVSTLAVQHVRIERIASQIPCRRVTVPSPRPEARAVLRRACPVPAQCLPGACPVAASRPAAAVSGGRPAFRGRPDCPEQFGTLRHKPFT